MHPIWHEHSHLKMGCCSHCFLDDVYRRDGGEGDHNGTWKVLLQGHELQTLGFLEGAKGILGCGWR